MDGFNPACASVRGRFGRGWEEVWEEVWEEDRRIRNKDLLCSTYLHRPVPSPDPLVPQSQASQLQVVGGSLARMAAHEAGAAAAGLSGSIPPRSLIEQLNADAQPKAVDNRVRVSRYCNSAAGLLQEVGAGARAHGHFGILGIRSGNATTTGPPPLD
jgi:hypothetical protein